MSALFFQNGVSIGANAGWCGYTGSNNYVVRYQFATGAVGADTVSVALGGIYYGSGAASQSFGFKISSSSVAYANARNLTPDSNYGTMSYSEGHGYSCVLTATGLNLAPNSVYYIFVYVATAGTEYYSGWNCVSPQISLSGSYKVPAGVISSITPLVSTLSPVSVILNSPQPYHKASFSCGEKILGQSEAFASALSLDCPREWMEADTKAQSIEITVSVQGFSDPQCTNAAGEVMYGSFILRADSLMRPVLDMDAVTYNAVNPGGEIEIDDFIAGISRAKVSFIKERISLANCAGAEIAGFALSYRDERQESIEAELETGILSSGTVINCIVVDSRGREGSVSLSLSMLPYVPPSLTAVEAVRCDAEGLDEALGEYFKLRAESAHTDFEGKNSCTLSLRLQPTGGDWGEEIPLPGFESGVWSHQWKTPAVLGGAMQGDSYKLSLTITDRLGVSARYTLDLYHQRWAMKFNAKGTALGLGMEPTIENALQMPDSWRLYAGSIILSEKSCGYAQPEDAVEEPVQGQLYFLLSD